MTKTNSHVKINTNGNNRTLLCHYFDVSFMELILWKRRGNHCEEYERCLQSTLRLYGMLSRFDALDEPTIDGTASSHL